MQVNDRAPIVARHSLDVAAAPETIWPVMAELHRWPEWNPDVKSVSVDGPVEPGTRFRWKAGPGTITSTLQAVDPPRELGWTGTTFGIKAVHVWRIEPAPTGSRIAIDESWEGLLPRLLRGSLQRQLDQSCREGLAAIKAEAERRR